jgi:6-pyruvoyltetrahydropterin/6-carboxytetrahydropterin synthase
MGMFEVTIMGSFSAAHLLADIGGKCEKLHGHNFKIEVTVAAKELNEAGILVDFREIKKWLTEILDNLDHKYLNECFFFVQMNPSSENIAKYVFQEMQLKAKRANITMDRVKVWESEDAAVTYILDKA